MRQFSRILAFDTTELSHTNTNIPTNISAFVTSYYHELIFPCTVISCVFVCRAFCLNTFWVHTEVYWLKPAF